MASAGLRRGALPKLRIKDLQRIEKFQLYQIIVYKREQEQYITYCSPECARHIDEHLDWRARLGEVITPTSLIFRREFDTTSHMHIARPIAIASDTVGHTMTALLDKTGVRPRTHGNHKSNLMQCHGFRKFFDTQCISHGINPLYCEFLMGHKTGLIKSYFKPTDQELLEGNDKTWVIPP
jgi:integrase